MEETARLARHSSSRTTEVIYCHELRPVITTCADVMDQIFVYTARLLVGRVPYRHCLSWNFRHILEDRACG